MPFRVLGIFILDLVKDGLLPEIDVVAAQGIDDSADLFGGDRAGLQHLRVRIVSVHIEKRALAGQLFASLLVEKGDRIGCAADFQADAGGKTFLEAAQTRRFRGCQDQVNAAGTGQL